MAVFTVVNDQVLLSTDAVELTDTFSNGLLLRSSDGAARAVDSNGDEYANGLLMTDAGQVAFVDATSSLPADTVWSNGLPRSGGRLCVANAVAAYWSNGIPFAANGAVSALYFSPSSLFASGEQGAWYDPSDFSTMFQDSAGTTPVTAVEQPVGRILDKSGRGNHATQSTAASRPVLRQEASGAYYLAFDGVDDGMVTSSINFSATDKMTVVAGVRKLSDAARGVLAELSASTAGNAGSFVLTAPEGATSNYGFGSRGSILNSPVAASPFAAPITNVLTGIGDISGDSAILRVNGTQAAISTADQGTGNYGNHPLFVGRRGGTTLPFNGRLYGLIVRGAASTAQQITQAESWMNSKTRAF